ncbi:MAG: AMP-dependent synthetase/ligase [Bacteroidales bacterium]
MKRIFDLLELYKGRYSYKKAALNIKRNNQWINYSADDYIKYSTILSQSFLRLNITKGKHVATVLDNCPEWNFIDMGLQQIGAIQVPVYPTISKEHFRHIFQDAEISVAIIGTKEIYFYIRDILEELNIQTFSLEKIDDVKTFDALLALGENNPQEKKIRQISSEIEEQDVATVIYTSGTTGLPKGVMLTHKNLVSQFLAVSPISGLSEEHRALSFLPLCHVYERMLNYMYQNLGLSVYYAESLDKVGENIRETKPHIFCAVPRVIEKTYDKIIAKGRSQKLIPKHIFFWAVNLGKRYDPNQRGSIFYRIQLFLANRIIFNKWRKALGNKLDIIVSGSATLQEPISRVFWAAGIKVLEGYGLTETSPVIAVSTPDINGVKIGTVGPALPGVEIKIANDGEILVRGPNIMKGYYKHPEWTKETIDQNGWLKTGDIGKFEDGRFLRITDRKKEIFKTSGGKHIAPQLIESRLKSSPFIEQAIVIGDGWNYAAALIVPNYLHLESWCHVKGLDYPGAAKAIHSERITNRIRKEVEKINNQLGKIEQIKRFALLEKPFNVENQTLSPTLKLRRNQITLTYKETINQLYEGTSGVDVKPRE